MKIFLGYSSEKLSVATEVHDTLNALGHEVWFDKKKEALPPGIEWDRERSSGQDDADLIVHVVSPDIDRRPGVVIREIRRFGCVCFRACCLVSSGAEFAVATI
jgi:hypothetical protein